MTAFPSPSRPRQGATPGAPNPASRFQGFAERRLSTTGESEAARALVLAIIKRIEAYLDEETAALEKSADFDFKASNDRKSQGLVDLNQAMRRLRKADVNTDLAQRLAAFHNKLQLNLKTIRLHMNAVKEIAAILSDAIQRSESDGTYSRRNPYGANSW